MSPFPAARGSTSLIILPKAAATVQPVIRSAPRLKKDPSVAVDYYDPVGQGLDQCLRPVGVFQKIFHINPMCHREF